MVARLVLVLSALGSARAACEVTDVKGCYEDSNTGRLLKTAAFMGDIKTQEACLEACCHDGISGSSAVAGVEYNGQCFCDTKFSPAAGTLRAENECASPCSGNKTQACGKANRIVVFSGTCSKPCATGPPKPKPHPSPSPPPTKGGCVVGSPGCVPNWMPCEDEAAKKLPFCDHTKTTAERVKNLVSLMTQDELCGQTYDKMAPIAKVPSWKGYNWNTECLHGLGAICNTVDGVTRCPSIFPAPPAMGATFNLTIAHELGRVISDEIRAYGNSNGHRGYQNRPVGVSAWGPNLNIYRDPRWGRNVEVPSEDPFHSGQYGVAYTKGLQWGNDTRYTKAIGALKHYTIYSVENSGGHGDVRGSDYFEIAMRDIEETYLPQFKAPVVEAKSLGYMCSYAALTSPSLDSDSASHPHSEPCCASKFFAITKMQEEYGFEGYVQSDCGAVSNEIHGEKYAANATDAAAKAIVDGHMNSCCGGGLQGNACAAIESGEMKQQDLVDRVTRSFTLLMDAGLFDPLEQQQYTKIPFDTINSESSQASMLEAARQSPVLLKNGNGKAILPLKKGGKLALIGPHTQTQKDLAGNYFEDIGLGTCSGPTCVPKLGTAFHAVNGQQPTVVAGCDMKCTDDSGFAAAVAAAKSADTVILALGIDGDICGEGKDRMNITLPGKQKDLADAVVAVGKPTVILIFSGGLVDLGDLKSKNVAIVQGWFPGATGGTAIAETVMGEQNRFGKLPFTWYNSKFTAASDFDNLNMTDGPGRTYKYLKDPSMADWPFGFGLSYTTFTMSNTTLSQPSLLAGSGGDSSSNAAASVEASIVVKNTGTVAGDEIVFLFKQSRAATSAYYDAIGKAPPEQPSRELIGFERVTLAAGASATVKFNATAAKLSSVDEFGTRHVLPGEHELVLSRGHGEEIRTSLEVKLDAADAKVEVGGKRLVLSTMVGFLESSEADLGLQVKQEL